MSDKPNKPGSDFDKNGADQAVKNQSTVKPEDYPKAEGEKAERPKSTGADGHVP